MPASYNLQQTEKVLRVDLTEKKTDNTTDKVIDLNTENTAVSGVNGVIVDDIDLNKEVEEAFKDFVWDDDTGNRKFSFFSNKYYVSWHSSCMNRFVRFCLFITSCFCTMFFTIYVKICRNNVKQ